MHHTSSTHKQETSWDLSALYPNEETWQKVLDQEKARCYKTLFAPWKNKRSWSAIELKQLLDLFFATDRVLRTLYTWAHLVHDLNTAHNAGQCAYQTIMAQYHAFEEATSFIEAKLVAHSLPTLHSFLQTPELSLYAYRIEQSLRRKKHTLTASQEALLAKSQKSLASTSNIFRAINDTDFVFDPAQDSQGQMHPITHGSYRVLLRHTDRTLRENSYKIMHTKYAQFENTFSEILQGEVQNHWFEAKARKYRSSLEKSLFPKEVPLAVYHTLIATVRQNIDVLHQYMHLRKKLLGVDALRPWDLYAPLVQADPMHYTYGQAQELTLQACAPLGQDYISILKKGLTEERWVDVYEKPSKRSGAYSSGCYDSFPYILLNFQGTLNDVFTLAHEAGHSMHSWYSNHSNPYHTADYSVFVAEVASTFNEELLAHHLLETITNPKEKAVLLHERLEDLRATLFRQTLFAEFELFIHERIEQSQPITSAILREKFAELNQFYYGDCVIQHELSSIEWARIPHFYYNFYVFQYATGISAARALAHKVLEEKNAQSYLQFLRTGGSRPPLDALRIAGIDMTQPVAIQQAIAHFAEITTQLKAIST